MKAKSCIFRIPTLELCYVYCSLSPFAKADYFSTTTQSSIRSSLNLPENPEAFPKCSAQVFRNYGCSETQICHIFSRKPSLRNAIPTHLESKLNLLRKLGVTSSELVRIVHCRPRFLSCRLNRYFDERLDQLQSLFGSRIPCVKAIIRNPSLLLYDFDQKIIPVFSLYEQLGVSKSDVISMLNLRPTLITRTNMSPEKLEYIRRTGICKGSKMYKYVVTIIGVSRIETIQEKVANFEKYGFSEDEVLELFGRSPLLLTLSVEKVQRNMTFVMGTMNLPAKTVSRYPFLLFSNVETLLRPRVLLANKMREMRLCPQIHGAEIFKALRMCEKRFLKVFVHCQEEEVRTELLMYYSASKRIKRLAESSKKVSYAPGFPF